MSLHVQQACLADLPAIVEIEQIIEGVGAASIEVLTARLKMFSEGFLVAKKNGQVVGYAESCLWNETVPSFKAESDFFGNKHRSSGHTLYLIFLGVDADCRRQGVASNILRELLRVAGQMEVERVHAVTWEYLVSLYTAQGFKSLGQIPDFMPDGIVTHMEYETGG